MRLAILTLHQTYSPLLQVDRRALSSSYEQISILLVALERLSTEWLNVQRVLLETDVHRDF